MGRKIIHITDQSSWLSYRTIKQFYAVCKSCKCHNTIYPWKYTRIDKHENKAKALSVYVQWKCITFPCFSPKFRFLSYLSLFQKASPLQWASHNISFVTPIEQQNSFGFDATSFHECFEWIFVCSVFLLLLIPPS